VETSIKCAAAAAAGPAAAELLLHMAVGLTLTFLRSLSNFLMAALMFAQAGAQLLRRTQQPQPETAGCTDSLHLQ
jgi:hypothetical protein